MAVEPLTLERAVRIALGANPELSQARERMRAAEFRADGAVAAYLPRVDLTWTYQDGRRAFEFRDFLTGETRLFQIPVSNHYAARLDASQTIFGGGRTLARIRRSRADTEAASYDLEATTQLLVRRVREQYYTVLGAEALIIEARDSLRREREALRVAKRLLAEGMSPRAEVLRAEVQEAAGEQRLLEAENALEIGRGVLNALLARDLETEITLASATEPPKPLGRSLAEFQEMALGRRPDLLAAQARLRAAKQGVNEATGSLLPRFEVRGSYGLQNPSLSLSRKQDDWQALGVVNFNVFNGGADIARLREARALSSGTNARLEDLERTVKLQARQAYLAVQEAARRFELAERREASAAENFRVVRGAYEQGLASGLDRLDAETVLTAARVERIQATYAYASARAALEWAVGAPVPAEVVTAGAK
jgi:outer membrane protein TolC